MLILNAAALAAASPSSMGVCLLLQDLLQWFLCVFLLQSFSRGRGNGGHLLLSKSRREGKRPVVKLCSPYPQLFFFGITNTALPPLEPTGVLGI